LQAEQRSSLSDGGEPWHGVRGGDSVELGGEYGNFKDEIVVVRYMCDGGKEKNWLLLMGWVVEGRMIWLGGARI
jgi:hypothetical protein